MNYFAEEMIRIVEQMEYSSRDKEEDLKELPIKIIIGIFVRVITFKITKKIKTYFI